VKSGGIQREETIMSILNGSQKPTDKTCAGWTTSRSCCTRYVMAIY
jgi:hypothetical protein